MKELKVIFATLLLAFMGFGLTACSDDDGDEPGGDNANVVGNWVGDDYDTFYRNVFITFNADGTGTAGLEHSGAITSVSRAFFTYKVKGNKITTSGSMAKANNDGEVDEMSFNCTFKVSGSTLTLEDSDNNWYKNNVKSFRKQ